MPYTRTTKQFLSIYFFVKPGSDLSPDGIDLKREFHEGVEGSQGFRWIDLKEIIKQDFTFPVDQHVAILLKEKFA